MLADLPPHQTSISQIPALTTHISLLLWELIFGRPNVGRSNPPLNRNFTDSYSDSSYFIPTLRTHICRPGVGRSTQPSNGNYRFLLWELIFGRPSVGRSIPPSNGNDTFLLWELIFDRPDVGRSTLLEWQFHRLLLWQLIFHSYSQNSYLAHQVLADLVPTSNGNYIFLLWELIFGRPSVGRCTPLFNADFTDSCFDHSYSIPNLRTHIWQTRCWQIYPTIKWQLKIPTLRAHIWQTRCWQIYPPLNGIFTDCCSDSSYFIPTLRTHIWHTSSWQI